MSRSIDASGIDQVLQQAVDEGKVPHVAAIAADADGVFYEGGAGVRINGESQDPVTTETTFRIMSMTKMVCTAAALQQKEAGDLDFDAPIEEYCPEWAEVKVLEGFDGDEPVLVEPRSKATVHQLVTHTTGLGYWFWNDQLVKYEAATGIPNVVPGSADAFKAPLTAHPGEKYTYGINTDWLGKVVEAVTGKKLDAVIAEGIADPLGMTSTTVHPDDAQRDRAVMVHVKGEDGAWSSAGSILNPEPEWWAGGHGLYSTPRDYIRFERALLRGGELDGQRILQEQTVEAAFRNQIGDLDFPAEIPTADPPITASFNAGPGHKWGYGLLLNTADVPGRRKAGTGAWAGLFNTHFFIDRATGVCASIYTNSLPFVTPDAFGTYVAFEEALYAAL